MAGFKNFLNEDKWVPCPKCGGQTHTKICEDAVLLKFPLYCPKCKQVTRIDIVKMKLVLSTDPDV